MKEFNVTAVIWQEDEVYVSKCPELKVASASDRPQEALENMKEAVELYIENAKILGILVKRVMGQRGLEWKVGNFKPPKMGNS